jgi:hypothetical protein
VLRGAAFLASTASTASTAATVAGIGLLVLAVAWFLLSYISTGTGHASRATRIATSRTRTDRK